MRFLLTGLLVLGLSGFAARADEKPLTVKQSLDELKKELVEAQKKHGLDLQKAQKAIREAKDDQKAEAQKKLAAVQADAPAPVYAVKFLELAEKNPTDPAAMGAHQTGVGDGQGRNRRMARRLPSRRRRSASRSSPFSRPTGWKSRRSAACCPWSPIPTTR